MTTRLPAAPAQRGNLARLRRARTSLTRPAPTEWPPAIKLAVLSLIVAGAAMVAVSAVIHLHLWFAGYRHIPRIGPAFLAQSVGGLLLAAVLLGYRRLVAIVLGALYLAGSIGALIISATVGFLGLHDGLDVPWAGASLAAEIMGAVALAAAGAAMVVARTTR